MKGGVRVHVIHNPAAEAAILHAQHIVHHKNHLVQEAIRNGSLQHNTQLAAAFPHTGDVEHKNATYLHLAAAAGNAVAVKHLLEKGAKPNAATNHGTTPLHLTTDPRVARLLINEGATLSAVEHQVGNQPLDYRRIGSSLLHHYAATANARPVTANTQFNFGDADVNAKGPFDKKDKDGATPLHIAAQMTGDQSRVVAEKLLDDGAYIHARDVNGHTPLQHALANDNRSVADLLVERGAIDGLKRPDAAKLAGLLDTPDRPAYLTPIIEKLDAHSLGKPLAEFEFKPAAYSIRYPGLLPAGMTSHEKRLSLAWSLLNKPPHEFTNTDVETMYQKLQQRTTTNEQQKQALQDDLKAFKERKSYSPGDPQAEIAKIMHKYEHHVVRPIDPLPQVQVADPSATAVRPDPSATAVPVDSLPQVRTSGHRGPEGEATNA
jgi:ankyrin repeat protein